ncbi:hypothetical protein Tco_0632232, partial [Tanacetum coccineum]
MHKDLVALHFRDTFVMDWRLCILNNKQVKLQAHVTPDYVPGPEEPEQAPPPPNFVPYPENPGYLAPADD